MVGYSHLPTITVSISVVLNHPCKSMACFRSNSCTSEHWQSTSLILRKHLQHHLTNLSTLVTQGVVVAGVRRGKPSLANIHCGSTARCQHPRENLDDAAAQAALCQHEYQNAVDAQSWSHQFPLGSRTWEDIETCLGFTCPQVTCALPVPRMSQGHLFLSNQHHFNGAWL